MIIGLKVPCPDFASISNKYSDRVKSALDNTLENQGKENVTKTKTTSFCSLYL